MKKFLFLLIAMAFSLSAYAADLEVSGKMVVEGEIWDNFAKKTEDTVTNAYHEMDLDLYAKMIIDETTYIQTKFEIRDQTAGLSDDDAYSTEEGVNSGAQPEVITERAYLHTMVGPVAVDLGLMEGRVWGTTFNDNSTDQYRIQALYKTSIGTFVGIIDKKEEHGNATIADSEEDDYDEYHIGYITQGAGFNWHLLLTNYQHGNFSEDIGGVADNTAGDLDVIGVTLAFDGKAGAIDLEGEIVQANYAIGGDLEDTYAGETSWSTVSAYINGSMEFGAHTAGLALVYASYDEDAAYGECFGDDFDFGLILSEDDIQWSAVEGNPNKTNVSAATGGKLYADIAVTDKFTISPAFIMASSNQKGTDWEGSTVTEIDVVASYKISDAVTYAAKFATASISVDEDYYGDEPDAINLLAQTVTMNF